MKAFNCRDYYKKMYDIVGVSMQLYNELKYGYSEAVYQECLSIMLTENNIPWEREKEMSMYFHGQEIKKKYVADFVCFDDIIVELKAISEITPAQRAQLLNYLRITDSPAGLLINFGHPNRIISEKYLFNPITNKYDFIRNADDLW